MSTEQIEPIYDPLIEVKARCLANLGEEEGGRFYFLWLRLMELQSQWGELQVLLNCSEADRARLNKYLPSICRKATDAMWRDMITGIVAFRDGNIQKKTSYAGLPALRRSLPIEFKARSVTVLDEFKSKINLIEQMRHNHISHYLTKAIELRQTDKLDQEQVEIGIDGIRTVLTFFTKARRFPYPQWQGGAAEKGGSESLLEMLRSLEK
ncbi:MAG: hypothetical protein IPI00_16390 [Flavobacteriales bacterium]|nr:hypothetical protein [Flavobacteriales bacterium]MBK6945587.1 hypothetical protein [Flavobacteriales bacterium]MBK7241702.1 hypothetical protein [Flavobacteriales bacterium]MBK7296307.1 hypothetical protein [Flavobacteriales bacterium]MBK9534859.1 hypothetical protein [Flavobacteriales bacterium]